MRPLKLITFVPVLFLFACLPQPDNQHERNNSFEKNAETVITYLHQYASEQIDYPHLFAKDFVLKGTWQGAKDSLNLSEAIAKDSASFALFDFKILTNPLVMLPGVDGETKKENGSVRYYGKWEVTLPATDSTDSKSTTIEMYETFDFNEEGKIIFQAYYGDFGGMRDDLLNK